MFGVPSPVGQTPGINIIFACDKNLSGPICQYFGCLTSVCLYILNNLKPLVSENTAGCFELPYLGCFSVFGGKGEAWGSCHLFI